VRGGAHARGQPSRRDVREQPAVADAAQLRGRPAPWRVSVVRFRALTVRIVMVVVVVVARDRIDHLLQLVLVVDVFEPLGPAEQLGAQLALVHVVVMPLDALPVAAARRSAGAKRTKCGGEEAEWRGATHTRTPRGAPARAHKKGLAVDLEAVEDPQPHHAAHAACDRRVPKAGQVRLDATVGAVAIARRAVPAREGARPAERPPGQGRRLQSAEQHGGDRVVLPGHLRGRE